MRIVLYSLTDLALLTAEKLIKNNHDVIVIDPESEKVDELSQTMDCSFLVGDASYPGTLEETSPKNVDYFLALSTNNQNNIVSCLIARSMGIEKTFLRINHSDFETVSRELGLNDIIIPAEIGSQYLYDAMFNANLLDLFELLKDKVSFSSIVAKEKHVGTYENLELDDNVRIICYFRDDNFYHFDDAVDFKEGDVIIFLTNKENESLLPKENE